MALSLKFKPLRDQWKAVTTKPKSTSLTSVFRCSVQQDCGSPGVSGLYGQSWRTSSPDLVVLSNTGGMVLPPATKPSPSQHQQGSEKPNKVLKKIDRRFSLPESAMISPDEETDDETGGTKIKPFPSLLESQVWAKPACIWKRTVESIEDFVWKLLKTLQALWLLKKHNRLA